MEPVHSLDAQPAIALLRPYEAGTRINHRWNPEEQMLAVEGFRRFGRDYVKIAEVIGTKTEAHLRTFFVNYRRRYQLDALLKNYDLCQQQQQKKLEQQVIIISPFFVRFCLANATEFVRTEWKRNDCRCCWLAANSTRFRRRSRHGAGLEPTVNAVSIF